MEKIGIDVHKVASQVCIRTEEGGFVEQRIATTRAALAKEFEDRGVGVAEAVRREVAR